jgi:hypothetical protein
MKLKSILKTLSPEYLEGIQAHWGISPADLGRSKDDDEKSAILVGHLYQRLQNRALWERATKDLSEDEWGLIHFLAIHGGDMDAEEVTARFFDGNVRDMASMVKNLARRGVVFFDDIPELSKRILLVGIPEPFLRYIELPSYWEGYLGYFLKELSTNELKHVATQGLKLDVESNCKNYLIWLIRRSLLDPKFLRRYIESLPDGPREIFQLLEQRGGVCVYRDLLDLDVQRHYDHQRVDALQWLQNTSGLVFTATPGANKYGNLLMIPRDVFYILTNHFAADTRTFRQLDSVSVFSKEETPAVILDNSNTLLRDLVVLCSWIDRHPVKVLATEGIGKNDLKRVLPSLSRFKSAKYIEFLSLFAIQKKFLVSNGDTYRVAPSFLTWLQDSTAAYFDLLTWWLTTTAWNEEFVDGNTVHVEPPVSGLVNIVPVRRMALDFLRELPKGRWISFDAFMAELGPKVAQEIPRRGEPLTYEKHTRSNELVLESIVAECLHWLGLIAVGLKDEDDHEVIGTREGDGKKLKARGAGRGRPRKQADLHFAFRLTDLGRHIIARPSDEWGDLAKEGLPDEANPFRDDTDKFIVQPTHEVIVPPDYDLKSFYNLNEVAEVRSIDVMSIMTVTKESVRAGMDRGLRAEEILAFLQKGSRTPLPQSLVLLVRECGAKHGEVNMGFAGGYIVVDDENLLTQIRLHPKIGPAVKDVIDHRVVLLNADADVKRLARELQKIGFMPRLASETVHQKDEDTFHLTLSREDLYTLIATVQFVMAVEDEKGRKPAEERLTPVLERLRPNIRTFQGMMDLAEPLVKMWTRAAQAREEAAREDLRQKFQSQLAQMVTTGKSGRAGGRAGYEGPNPARETDEIRTMLEWAIEHEHDVEIEYIKSNHAEVREVILPESIENDRLLARARSQNDKFSMYRLDRVMKSRLA